MKEFKITSQQEKNKAINDLMERYEIEKRQLIDENEGFQNENDRLTIDLFNIKEDIRALKFEWQAEFSIMKKTRDEEMVDIEKK